MKRKSSAPPAPSRRPQASLDHMQQSIAASIKTSAVGGVFRYDLVDSVTVPDRSSTLVSLINNKVEGQDVFLFKPEEGGAAATHPYRSVRFKNSTSYLLEGGPVAIFARNTFVGEGIFDRIEAGADTWLPYALEYGLSLSRTDSSREEAVRLLSISNGELFCEVRHTHNATYEVVSKTTEKRTLYVQFPHRPGWDLNKEKHPTAFLTGSYWYVPFLLQGSKQKVEIEEISPVQQSVAFDSRLADDVFAVYLGDPRRNPELAAAIEQIRKLRKRLDEIDGEKARYEERSNELAQQEERIRENINVLGKRNTNADLRRELGEKLARHERDIDALQGKIVKLDEEHVDVEGRMRVLTGELRL